MSITLVMNNVLQLHPSNLHNNNNLYKFIRNDIYFCFISLGYVRLFSWS